MQVLKAFNFRDFYKQLIFIEDQEILDLLKNAYKMDVKDDDNGILAYGFIKDDQGLVFTIMSIVKYEDGKITSFNDQPMEKKLKHILRLDDIFNKKAARPQIETDQLHRYVDWAVEINEKNFQSEELEAVRLNDQIDEFRHFIYPDDLEAYIYNTKTKKLEGLWARSYAMTNTSIMAKLITPVSEEFGFKLNDDIELRLYKVNDKIRLMHII